MGDAGGDGVDGVSAEVDSSEDSSAVAVGIEGSADLV